MVRAIEGTYRNGKVELKESPAGVDGARVLVVFVPEQPDENHDSRVARVARVLEDMKHGMDLGGAPYPAREDLHDRFDRRG